MRRADDAAEIATMEMRLLVGDDVAEGGVGLVAA